MSLVLATTVSITAPASVDGMGEVATLNDSASGTFVGWVFKATGFGGPVIRTSMDDLVEDHGAVFGSFYRGARSFTLEVALARATTRALSDARYYKLCRAFNAMVSDGTLAWTDTDAIPKQVTFRCEQSPSDPDDDGHVLLAGICQDPRIYAVTPQTGSSPKTNVGNANSPPTFTLTPTGGNVVITNTTAGLGSPALTLTVGAGYVTTGTAVTVDFGAKTVTQGGVRVPQAVSFPSSTWWKIVPGANTWTVTNASSVSISFRDAWLSA